MAGVGGLSVSAVLRQKIRLFLTRLAQASTACLLVMVGGDITALSVSHWLIALKTGSVSAGLFVLLSLTPLGRFVTNGLATAILITLVTTLADYVVHPGHFSVQSLEAIVTGLGAGAIYLIVSDRFGDKPAPATPDRKNEPANG